MEAARLQVRVEADTGPAERGLRGFGNTLSNTARSFATAGAFMTAGFTVPLVLASRAILRVGINFESAFADVEKTVEATDEQLAELRSGILSMSNALPSSAVEIANVASAAGQLGIATENILGFTRTMIDLGETTNLSADMAASELARFANIMQMPQDQFDRLGSTVVDLGNKLATTEAEIVSMGMRIAGAGAQIGLTEAEVMGFAAALSSVGIEAEAGGSAISRVFVDMANAVAKGGKELAGFAAVADMSAGAFAKLFADQPAEAVVAFIEGLDRLSDSGANVFQVLEDLGFSEIRVRDALLRMANAGDLVSKSLDIANTAWEENVALSNEAATRYDTTAAKLEVLQNQFQNVGEALFSQIEPGFNRGIESVTAFTQQLIPLVAQFSALPQPVQNAALAFTAVVAAAGPVLGIIAGISGALSLLGGAAGPILLVTGALATLAAAWGANLGGMQERTQAWVSAISPAFQRVADLISTIAKGGDINAMLTAELQIDWSEVDVNAAGLIDAVSAQLRKQNWQDEGQRAGAIIVEPFKKGVFAGFVAAVASEDWEPERPMWDVALGNLNRVFWERIGEFGRGMIEGATGLVVPEPEPLSDAAESFMKDGNILLAAITTWGDNISAEMTTLGTEFDRITTTMDTAAQSVSTAITNFIDKIMKSVNAILARFGLGTGTEEVAPRVREPRVEVMPTREPQVWSTRGFSDTLADTLRSQPPVEIPATPHFSPQDIQAFIDALPPIKIPVQPDLRPIQGPERELLPTMWEFPTMQEMMDRIRGTLGAAPADGGIDIPLKAVITETIPSDTLEPLQIKGILMGLDETRDAAGEALSTGAGKLGSTLSGFQWPPLPPWEWSPLPPWTWPPIDPPGWMWKPIPVPAWLDRLVVPRPSWLGQLLAWTPTVVVTQGAAPTVPGQLQHGTNYWRGGLTWVGEQGPELVSLPRGSQVHSAQETRAMMGATVNVYANVSSDLDIHQLAYQVAQELKRYG